MTTADMTTTTTEPTQEQCGRLVQIEVHACVSSIVTRMLEHEPELHEDFENASVRECPTCNEEIRTATNRGAATAARSMLTSTTRIRVRKRSTNTGP